MKKLIIIAVLSCSTVLLNAQPAEPNPPGPPAPIGFVEVLVLAGAALGGKKAHDRFKVKEE